MFLCMIFFFYFNSKLQINVDLTIAMKCQGDIICQYNLVIKLYCMNFENNTVINHDVEVKFKACLILSAIIKIVKFLFLDIGADILDLAGATIDGENIKEEAVNSQLY